MMRAEVELEILLPSPPLTGLDDERVNAAAVRPGYAPFDALRADATRLVHTDDWNDCWLSTLHAEGRGALVGSWDGGFVSAYVVRIGDVRRLRYRFLRPDPDDAERWNDPFWAAPDETWVLVMSSRYWD